MMKTEMDAMNMDERQKFHWLMANRVTLMIVGMVWIGMIVYHAVQDNVMPYFLIIMVPVMALIRFVVYKYYAGKG
jgi:hypothetical protein